ncbi:YesK family protein [Halobacillus sp. ACCC02827]|uniref:YesK family protein n=1 Tax=Bacillaceae TaxID=186817 RepID=UPI0002A4D76E|nr:MULTISPECIES: YesK family protein [Bacillaceae]ELK47827.1 Bifunctional preprotein translocase subunit SecD/SecF [Halobacillus sp. BAB-2008]QHT48479.1 hypothetical protein M662_18975 [Bacillus sp. SB49]WJE15717.1 YesK family protein [Halobacillus sp. ACCC02827]
MMIGGPFLVATIPGVLVVILSYWLAQKNLPLLVKMLPTMLAALAATILFFVGFVMIRGFEGAAYSLLAIFLMGYAVVASTVARKRRQLLKEKESGEA